MCPFFYFTDYSFLLLLLLLLLLLPLLPLLLPLPLLVSTGVQYSDVGAIRVNARINHDPVTKGTSLCQLDDIPKPTTNFSAWKSVMIFAKFIHLVILLAFPNFPSTPLPRTSAAINEFVISP